ncbi:cation diffusion facilitator family transporter [Rhizohabitans arisaemae]|uniref:cation diffusion facilitator family transporter n=1 Tax=Rhizohabitans arisaemae TaxID=2720610 RepID=UPI0024B20E9B|nr:cation diffusion facilitator family transporter [Rhizohabitans arisaemae]
MGGGHQSAAARHRGRLVIVLGISSVVFIAQIAGGVAADSLALISDSLHVATDITGVLLALIATTLAARPPSPGKTFGYLRLEVFAAVVNAILLFSIAIWIFTEAYGRFFAPPVVESGLVLVIALIGLVVNAISLRLLHAGQAESLNVRGAYLEVLGDLLGSIAVVAAAIGIGVTGWYVIDPIASVLVALMILPRAWRLLRDALDVLLEATPKNVDLAEVRRHLLAEEGVVDVHDLHAWTITSGLPILTAHIVVGRDRLSDPGPLLDRLHRCLIGHFDVEHCTLQLEPEGHSAHEGNGHA